MGPVSDIADVVGRFARYTQKKTVYTIPITKYRNERKGRKSSLFMQREFCLDLHPRTKLISFFFFHYTFFFGIIVRTSSNLRSVLENGRSKTSTFDCLSAVLAEVAPYGFS